MFSQKSNIILALALCCALASEAKPRTQAQILQLAGEALTSKVAPARRAAGKAELSVAYASKALTVVGRSNGGYAVISNDDLLPAVLAYSPTDFSKSDTNPGLKWWLGAVEEAAEQIVAEGLLIGGSVPTSTRFLPKCLRCSVAFGDSWSHTTISAPSNMMSMASWWAAR